MSQPATPHSLNHAPIAATFDDWARRGKAESMEHGHGDVVAQVVAQMDVRAGQRILDLGCGSGWATRLLAQAAPGATAVGVDVSPAMIERAEAAHTNTIRARYELGAFEALGFKDHSFDRVFSMEALYYALDLDQALAEALRVLKRGGALDLVVDYYKESPDTEGWSQVTGLAMQWLSESEWKQRLERAGFSQVSTRRVIDRRGPGVEARFEPGACHPDWHTKASIHQSGSLWLHGVRA